jgi:predicted nuclease of predicted toxin-antitoxin system
MTNARGVRDESRHSDFVIASRDQTFDIRHFLIGSMIRIIVPRPSSLSASTRPPWS